MVQPPKPTSRHARTQNPFLFSSDFDEDVEFTATDFVVVA